MEVIGEGGVGGLSINYFFKLRSKDFLIDTKQQHLDVKVCD